MKTVVAAMLGVLAVALPATGTCEEAPPNRSGRVKLQTPLGTLFEHPDGLKQALDRGWKLSRELGCALIRSELEGRTVQPEVRVYDVDCAMAHGGTLSVEQRGDGIAFVYSTRENQLALSSTKPAFLGSFADPRFSVRYDVDLVLTLAVRNGALVVRAAEATVTGARIAPEGPTASMVEMAYDTFVRGPRFREMVAARVQGQTVRVAEQVNAALGPVNEVLRKARPLLDVVRARVAPDHTLLIQVAFL